MDKAKILRYFHLSMTIFWAIMIIPTIIWWRDSILWLAIMSVYANLMASFAAYQGARVEKKENGD
jgi:hypothetical protein